MSGEAFEDRDTYTLAPPDDAYLIDLLSSKAFLAIAAIGGIYIAPGKNGVQPF